jgi:hypothetical protein|tara:strand:- start:87 stop:374 length:288 start_codon:yes stop_codon:yes gene_type:complete
MGGNTIVSSLGIGNPAEGNPGLLVEVQFHSGNFSGYKEGSCFTLRRARDMLASLITTVPDVGGTWVGTGVETTVEATVGTGVLTEVGVGVAVGGT